MLPHLDQYVFIDYNFGLLLRMDILTVLNPSEMRNENYIIHLLC